MDYKSFYYAVKNTGFSQDLLEHKVHLANIIV